MVCPEYPEFPGFPVYTKSGKPLILDYRFEWGKILYYALEQRSHIDWQIQDAFLLFHIP